MKNDFTSQHLAADIESEIAALPPEKRALFELRLKQLHSHSSAEAGAKSPMLSYAERQEILVDWNRTEAAYPGESGVHQLFEEQVTRTPDNVAVVYKDQSLTYDELNRKANQLAHTLRGYGVGADTLVGICVERSLEMVIGLLGILKAGGAYVPLDPAYPQERLAFMLEDTQVGVLLTQRALVERLPKHHATVLCLDSDWGSIANAGSADPAHITTAGHLAYVIYTSGSTGKPKGVEVCHRGISRLLFGIDYVTLDDKQSFLHLAPISFDASTFELWAPLLHGARCILVPENKPTLEELGSLIRKHNISILWLTASLFNTVIDNAPGILSSIKYLLTGGEALSVHHVRRALKKLPDTQLVNCYGPTESTTFATCYQIPVHLDQDIFSIPIGRPIANTTIYILDPDMQPVAVGSSGEVYIGGAGLARGYLNRPGLTAESFVPHPFSNDPLISDNSRARLYKTGDLARYLPDGNIEFLGRIDHQIKLHGFRIEPGEIEAVLAQHPAVREVVVIARQDTLEDRRLVAYITSNTREQVSTQEFRQYLKARLPDYMFPSAYVMLDQLPLSPNGKIDRNALPAPDNKPAVQNENYVLPRSPVEKKLADIWSDTLGVEKIGIFDNFFELGGHSLLATRLMSRVLEIFQVELPLHILFQQPSIISLAEAIENSRQVISLAINTIDGHVATEGYPLSYAQQRLWFLDQLEQGSALYSIPRSLRLRGKLDITVLHKALNAIIVRHETLRTTFQNKEGEPIQVIAPSLTLGMPTVDLSALSEEEREREVQRLSTEAARQPFDLARGPLIRATLLHLADQDHVLLLAMHHIISDGWSMGVFNRELSLLYKAFIADEPSPLPELPTQYADFAQWQRQWLQGAVLDTQLAYWKEHLKGIPPLLELDTDRPRPAIQSYRGAKQSCVISSELTRALKTLSQAQGATLFMTLLAAFQLLLYRHTGQDDIVVGSPIANRTRVEIEDLIGFFVNTLVLRGDLSGNPTFTELLGRVREVALGAYAHQDLPFEKLVQELQPERSLSRNPLCDIIVNYQISHQTIIELPGLTLDVFEQDDPESKFTMTLYINDLGDQLEFNLVYQDVLFTPERISLFLDQFNYLLEQIVESPQKLINSYSLVTERACSMLPDPTAPIPVPLYELTTDMFASWVKQAPANVAISQGNRQWSYSDLAASSYRLAHLICAQGIKKGEIIAIFGQRSFGQIAAVLASLLSGGVFLTIDRNLPVNRQRLMLQEANAKYAFCVGDIPTDDEWVKDNASLFVINVDAYSGDWLNLVKPEISFEFNLPLLEPDDAAYIFFTSGSTGVPKGVLGCHKGISHFFSWQRKTFDITPEDRCSQLINVSFDAMLRDIFLPLTSGAMICVPDDDEKSNPVEVLSWLKREKITVLHTVPALAHSWLTNPPPGLFLDSLRFIFFSGEQLIDTLVNQWREIIPLSCKVVNLYGATETTLIKSYYQIPDEMMAGAQPVGWAMPETQILVMKENYMLCGIGEPGEIIIRTPFRSLGYINAPEENSKKFVKNPFGDDKSDLLYHTGDRGCCGIDGALKIHGRIDHQVKIRGVRVEPDEITAVLSRHSQIKSGIVVPHKNQQDQTILVAYIVPREPHGTTERELRLYLVKHLSAVMVPAVFVFLEQLPLMPNGKVDRRALPSPDNGNSDSGKDYIASRTGVEKTLSTLWCRMFNIEKVGIHDNFFELGGHSLIATQLAAQIRNKFDVAMSLREFFEVPTIEAMAIMINQYQTEKLDHDEIEQMLSQLESLSDEETHARLSKNDLSERAQNS